MDFASSYDAAIGILSPSVVILAWILDQVMMFAILGGVSNSSFATVSIGT
jgi:hypothetical protein